LVPVEIGPAAAVPPVNAQAPSASPGRRRRKSGVIEIELGGSRRVRVDREWSRGAAVCAGRARVTMVPVPSGARVWLATGDTANRRVIGQGSPSTYLFVPFVEGIWSSQRWKRYVFDGLLKANLRSRPLSVDFRRELTRD